MKKIFLFIILFAAISFSQTWKETFDIWNDFGHTTETDSIYFDTSLDQIVIWGDDVVHIFIPVNDSKGALRIWGIVTHELGTLPDGVTFHIAAHSGTPDAIKTGYTPEYFLMETEVLATTGATSQFSLWPMSNATLRESQSEYMDLKITGNNNNKRSFYIKIEWMEE